MTLEPRPPARASSMPVSRDRTIIHLKASNDESFLVNL